MRAFRSLDGEFESFDEHAPDVLRFDLGMTRRAAGPPIPSDPRLYRLPSGRWVRVSCGGVDAPVEHEELGLARTLYEFSLRPGHFAFDPEANGKPWRIDAPPPWRLGVGPPAVLLEDVKREASRVDEPAFVGALLRERKPKQARLAEFMIGRNEATYEDLASEVHGDDRTTDDAVEKNVRATTDSAVGLNCRVRYEAHGGKVFKAFPVE